VKVELRNGRVCEASWTAFDDEAGMGLTLGLLYVSILPISVSSEGSGAGLGPADTVESVSILLRKISQNSNDLPQHDTCTYCHSQELRYNTLKLFQLVRAGFQHLRDDTNSADVEECSGGEGQ
jgi:hypothetical protein